MGIIYNIVQVNNKLYIQIGSRVKPYKIIDESVDSVTYQYNSYYTWTLYALIVVYFVGMFQGIDWLYSASMVGMLIYLGLKFGLGWSTSAKIRSALKYRAVKLSGSKSSFRNPLTIVVPKDVSHLYGLFCQVMVGGA